MSQSTVTPSVNNIQMFKKNTNKTNGILQNMLSQGNNRLYRIEANKFKKIRNRTK